MKASLRSVESQGVRYQALMFVCPGCAELGGVGNTGLHMLPVNSTEKSPSWDWDGNIESPTLSPSILTRTAPYVDGVPTGVCHSFLRNGVFEFLDDCTHSMAGKSIPMVELPEWDMFQ